MHALLQHAHGLRRELDACEAELATLGGETEGAIGVEKKKFVGKGLSEGHNNYHGEETCMKKEEERRFIGVPASRHRMEVLSRRRKELRELVDQYGPVVRGVTARVEAVAQQLAM